MDRQRSISTLSLPPALRRVATHGPQLRRLLVRRQTPKANFAVFGLLFLCILAVFARIASLTRLRSTTFCQLSGPSMRL